MSEIHISAAEARKVYERISSITGCKVDDLTSEKRTQCLVQARWHIMRELRRMGASMPQIGRLMGMDYSTVNYGLRRLAKG